MTHLLEQDHASCPSSDHPVYTKVQHDDGAATQRFMIIIDEGWRQSILCERMYEWQADWLLGQLSHRPSAPVSL